MVKNRPQSFGSLNCETTGIVCEQEPVCALVAAVYQDEGWKAAT